MGRKRSYIPKPFESSRESPHETFASLHKSLLESLAWKTLTKQQQLLYVYCKLQYYDEHPRGSPEFTMNQSKWQDKYGLYKEGNQASFYKDMGALIMHGFVDCIYNGAPSRRKSKYKLSNRWREYGNPGYEVPPTVMTTHLLRIHSHP